MKSIQNYPAETFEHLKQLYRASAQRFGDLPCLLERGAGGYRSISYQQMGNAVDALGTALLHEGFEGNILILGENCPAWAISFLAVASGVGAAVAADPRISPQQLKSLISYADIRGAICSSSCLQALKKTAPHLPAVSFEELEGNISKGELFIMGGDRSFLDAVIDPDGMCAMFFASHGKDGQKGIMLSHQNLCFTLAGICRMVRIEPADVFLSSLPLHHLYACLCGFLCPLYRGCSVGFLQSYQTLTKEMRALRPTVMLCVPTLLEKLLESLERSIKRGGLERQVARKLAVTGLIPSESARREATKKALPEIHGIFGGRLRMLLSGAALPSPEVKSRLERLGFFVLQGHGLTECTALMALERDQAPKGEGVGCALPDTILDIDDPENEGMGEVRCRGAHVMMGYYKDPEGTASVIRDGWLHTGDIGWIDQKGLLHLVGKKANRIQTEKGDVYPEECEAYLRRNRFVSEAVVVGDRGGKEKKTRLVAVIRPDTEELEKVYGRNFLPGEMELEIKKAVAEANGRLAPRKRIATYLLYPAPFPKTPTGKWKRQELSAFAQTGNQPRRKK